MQAISGQLTWLEAEDILGWRYRTLRRWRLRYYQRGYDGLWDRRRQQPSPRCAPVAEVAPSRASIWRRCRVQGGPLLWARPARQWRHARLHVRQTAVADRGPAAQAPPAGPAPPLPRAPPLLRRAAAYRREPPAWLALRPRAEDVIPIIDDATKRVLYAQLVAAESTATIMAALWSVLVTHGLPQALYSDRASWAFYTLKAGQPVAKEVLTQVGRALARSASSTSPRTRPRPAVAASASTAPFRSASSMSCAWRASPRCPPQPRPARALPRHLRRPLY